MSSWGRDESGWRWLHDPRVDVGSSADVRTHTEEQDDFEPLLPLGFRTADEGDDA